MPKIKAFAVLTLLVIFSFSLFGCGLIADLTGGGEEVLSGQEGELPEWLLLSHRAVENEVAVDDDSADNGDALEPPPAPQETAPEPAPAPAPAPAPEPAPEPEPETEYADPTTPTGSMEVRQAKNALDKIAKELNDFGIYDFGFDHSELSEKEKERISELVKRAETIDRALRAKYGITYVPDVGGGGGFGDEWSPFN